MEIIKVRAELAATRAARRSGSGPGSDSSAVETLGIDASTAATATAASTTRKAGGVNTAHGTVDTEPRWRRSMSAIQRAKQTKSDDLRGGDYGDESDGEEGEMNTDDAGGSAEASFAHTLTKSGLDTATVNALLAVLNEDKRKYVS